MTGLSGRPGQASRYLRGRLAFSLLPRRPTFTVVHLSLVVLPIFVAAVRRVFPLPVCLPACCAALAAMSGSSVALSSSLLSPVSQTLIRDSARALPQYSWDPLTRTSICSFLHSPIRAHSVRPFSSPFSSVSFLFPSPPVSSPTEHGSAPTSIIRVLVALVGSYKLHFRDSSGAPSNCKTRGRMSTMIGLSVGTSQGRE